MKFEYRINAPISVDRYIGLLKKTTLAQRRPIGDRSCIAGMLSNSNLMVSAWSNAELAGISRAVTDFHYACYLSDLAVHQRHQGIGVGKELIAVTQAQLGPKCKLILIAAPAADSYYEHLGFERNPFCWVLSRDHRVNRMK